MEKIWKKSNVGNSLTEIVNYNSGGKLQEFIHPSYNYYVPNMRTFAGWLLSYRDRQTSITVFGDYDVDGVCASAEMYLLLMALGFRHIRIRLPKRISEGYGISENFIDEVANGVIVTVDNGIKAMGAVRKAKKKGLVVMIMDHHQPEIKNGSIQLPEADLIVDPHIPREKIQKEDYPENFMEYTEYCAAGLVFKLAEILLRNGPVFDKIASMAAIATIADVVDLTGDNRNLYRYGIQCIAAGHMTAGLGALVRHIQPGCIISEDDIGFKIGPILNAPGRLYDKGATEAFSLLVTENYDAAQLQLQSLLLANEKRKEEKKQAYKRAKEQIASLHMEQDNPVIIVDPETSEGIVGLVAGDICEEYGVTTIVLTEKNGNYKGSARACEGDSIIDLLNAVYESHPEYFISYGGHPGAAGLSVRYEHIDAFKKEISSKIGPRHGKTQYLEYDLEIRVEDIPRLIEELKKYAPYGQGNKRPVFLIREFRLAPKDNLFFKFLGEDSIRVHGNGCTAVGFGIRDKFIGDYPSVIDIVGTLTENRFMKRTENQIEILDIKIPEKENTCSLMDSIAKALQNL